MGRTAADYLASQSHWAAVRLSTQLQTSGSTVVIPVITPPEIVRKVVKALYSGHLELSDDVEQIMLMADCMQTSCRITPYHQRNSKKCMSTKAFTQQACSVRRDHHMFCMYHDVFVDS